MIHVCTSNCYCPQCGKHLVSKPFETISDTEYAMFMGCPDGHYKIKVGSVTYANTTGAGPG